MFSVDQGVFLFDENWDEAYRNVDRSPRLEHAGRDSLKHRYFLVQHMVYVGPGAYQLVVEVGDRIGGSIGTFRKSRVFTRGDTLLEMSDLLLASQIASVNPFPESRTDLTVVPNPLRTFGRSEPVFIYLEVYHLTRDAFGRTAYEISYRMGAARKDAVDPGLFAAQDLAKARGRVELAVVERPPERPQPVFDGEAEYGEDEATPGGMVEEPSQIEYQVQYVLSERRGRSQKAHRVRSEGKQVETAVTARYEGGQEEDFTYLQIDIRYVPCGVHRLTVTARDIHTGQTAEREVLFRVVE